MTTSCCSGSGWEANDSQFLRWGWLSLEGERLGDFGLSSENKLLAVGNSGSRSHSWSRASCSHWMLSKVPRRPPQPQTCHEPSPRYHLYTWLDFWLVWKESNSGRFLCHHVHFYAWNYHVDRFGLTCWKVDWHNFHLKSLIINLIEPFYLAFLVGKVQITCIKSVERVIGKYLSIFGTFSQIHRVS